MQAHNGIVIILDALVNISDKEQDQGANGEYDGGHLRKKAILVCCHEIWIDSPALKSPSRIEYASACPGRWWRSQFGGAPQKPAQSPSGPAQGARTSPGPHPA